ncbi:MAG TPA: porin family protein [Bacteroidales bacterium]
MRQFFIILLHLLLLSSLNGQQRVVLNEPNHDDRPIHFGFCLGLNMMNFVVHTSYDGYQKNGLLASVSKPQPGFHIQVVSNYRLGEYFDLRFLPGVSFGQRNLVFYKDNKVVNDGQKLESNFLEFPFLIKYKAKRLNNFRPYVITGTNFRYDLAKTLSEDDGIYLALKKFDIYYEAGAGIDCYLPYFKMSIELKYSYGLLNVLRRRDNSHPQYQDAIDRLNSTITMLSFHFE